MNKIKVLMLSDHPLATSGVATQSRWLIEGLINTGRYTFRCLGAAVKHDSYDVVKVNDDLIIKPIDGFGNQNMLRMILAVERPDVLLLFTDPRFFQWVWDMEDEVHQLCPIAYNHLWDNPPWPEFNRTFYESTDLINCINRPTYEMVHSRFPDRTNYVPHAVPRNVFFPLPDAERKRLKASIIGKERADHFIVLYVGRNARRKVPNDIIVSFKMFLDKLEAQHGHRKATLVMHTDPNDIEGPNLHQVIDMLQMKNDIVFSNDRVGFDQMNSLYNISDVLVNASLNEGFGLPVLEMKMTEGLVVATKTGGLTEQVQDNETGQQFGVAMEPDVRMLVGNQMVPYIYEDAVKHETVCQALLNVFAMPVEERKRIGALARKHAMKNFDMSMLIADWDASLLKLHANWKAGKTPGNVRWECFEI